MIVCVCRRVSDRDIHGAARDGVASFDALQDELGVATACGACLDCARDTWAQARCGAQPALIASHAPAAGWRAVAPPASRMAAQSR
jgi:bacterioferritin-associated ferredoxin